MTPLTTEQVLDILWQHMNLAFRKRLIGGSGPLPSLPAALEEAVRNLLTAHDVVPKETL